YMAVVADKRFGAAEGHKGPLRRGRIGFRLGICHGAKELMVIGANGNPDLSAGNGPSGGSTNTWALHWRYLHGRSIVPLLGCLAMTRLKTLLAIGIVMIAGTAWAADNTMSWRYNAHGSELPFPRSERAQTVW